MAVRDEVSLLNVKYMKKNRSPLTFLMDLFYICRIFILQVHFFNAAAEPIYIYTKKAIYLVFNIFITYNIGNRNFNSQE